MSSKTVATNKKVYFDYSVEEEFEAGVALTGTEVKSIRQGHIIIAEAFVHINEQLQPNLVNAHIKEFFEGNINNHTVDRTRKLLLKKKEIKRLFMAAAIKGYTIKPLSVYFKKHLVKVKIGLCKGKKKFDKRETLKKRDNQRAMDRVKKSFNNK